ncbi:MAG: hypoxanthine phosphoribosyltransferase [Chitinophagaceae bacterium]
MHDKFFIVYLSEEIILQKVKEIAQQINKDYAEKKPLFIAILNGSFMFAADLFKQLNVEAEISFIKFASYKGTKNSGHIITAIGLYNDVTNRDVIILEDIIDSGNTLHQFLPQLIHQQPSSLKIAALLHKPEAAIHPIKIDYCGFHISNKFVVGYGLDYDGLGRNFKDIYCEKEN